MSHTISVEEASATLAELVRRLRPGDEIVLTADDKPVARLTPDPAVPPRPRVAGLWKGKLTVVAEDDEHLDDFAEHR